jgi:hypothetical protein
MDQESATKYFDLQDIVNDIVDLACVDCVDVGDVKEIGEVITDMITIIEATDELAEGATLVSLKQEAEIEAWREREKFQKQWLEMFNNESGTERSALGGSTLLIEDDDDDDVNGAALFYDGSRTSIATFADGVRVCLSKASITCTILQNLLAVANSTVEALDLTKSLQSYSQCVAKREAILGENAVEKNGGQVARGPANTGITVVAVSKEFEEFPLPPVDPLRCLTLSKVSGKLRFPTITRGPLAVLQQHVTTPDLTLPYALEELSPSAAAAEELLEMAMQVKAPLLALRLATVIFGAHRTGVSFFDAMGAQRMRTLMENSFLFEYGVKDWLHMEVLGGQAIAPAMDVMWWVRFLREATTELESKRQAAFTDHEGVWRQVYAETRVRVFVAHGVHALSSEEVALWAESIGRYVEYLSLRDTRIGDAEVEVLSSCCPQLKSLDLSFTAVTDKAVAMLVHSCHHLAECSVQGCDVSAQSQDALKRHCTENRRRGS